MAFRSATGSLWVWWFPWSMTQHKHGIKARKHVCCLDMAKRIWTHKLLSIRRSNLDSQTLKWNQPIANKFWGRHPTGRTVVNWIRKSAERHLEGVSRCRQNLPGKFLSSRFFRKDSPLGFKKNSKFCELNLQRTRPYKWRLPPQENQ